MKKNNIILPLVVLMAGAMIAGAIVYTGTQSQAPTVAQDQGVPSGGQMGGDRQLWGNIGIHRTYAEELGLDADALVSCVEEGRFAEAVSGSSQEAVAQGGSGTPFFIINGEPVSGAQPLSAFSQIINAAQAEAEVSGRPELDIDIENWPTLGENTAPVLMVEYSDYTCPFCKRFAEDTKPLIVQRYVDAGIVQFVRKDFITVGGPVGAMAAQAALCAGEQGQYWEYHAILTERQ